VSEFAARTLTEVTSVTSGHDDSEPKTPSIIRSDGRFSCVVDEHPRFHLDALRWFASLTEVAGVIPGDLMVHVVGSESSEVLLYLKAQGVTVRTVEPFDPRSPHCNKIAGALRLADDPIDGMVILCDTDLAVLEDPRRLELPSGAVAGKPVDAPVPPMEVILDIFVASGLDPPPRVRLPWGPNAWTVSGNNNGGLYLVPAPLLPRVACSWARSARWLLDRIELLQEWAIYVDQVAMALALTAEGIESVALDVRWNTPTHDLSRIPPDAPEPAILHYHQEVDRAGLLLPTASGSIDHQIAVANRAIAQVWQRVHPSRTHREWLRLIDGAPNVEHADPDVRTILSELIEVLQPASVLEVGCLDSNFTKGLMIGHHVGIDGSDDVVRRARAAEPDGRFVVGTLAEHHIEADLTVCLGELMLSIEVAEYRTLVELLWKASRRALLISGYEDPNSISDTDTQFHEPLSVTLHHVAPNAEIYPVKHDGRVATFVALKSPVDKHPRDYVASTLAPLVARHPNPLSLVTLRLHARRTTGFYPDHAPRLWEYPVVAGLVADHLPPGSRLLDVGAGVTPLAPFLTSQGYTIDTVDPSETIRTWPPQPDWNEWDFLDYGTAGLAHRSWNCTVGELPVRPTFDGAYSVSVIEHVPAESRRALLADMSARTRLGGLVVLTIDLLRGGDDLWNRNLGVEVEDFDTHGSFQDVIAECAAVGLELFRDDVVRDWGDTRVDIGLLAMRQTRPPLSRRWRGIGQGILSRVRARERQTR
jgi:2-polyprenyl-3-methyl-5-hydroxy-6-metoxy-1,4-benzoquinol methylase